MTLTLTTWIILGIVWLVISELFYISMIKSESKQKFKSNWLGNKIASLVFSGLIMGATIGLFYSLKDYIKESLMGLGILAIVVLFFYLNYKLGKRIKKIK